MGCWISKQSPKDNLEGLEGLYAGYFRDLDGNKLNVFVGGWRS
jgi:hypothetical protein